MDPIFETYKKVNESSGHGWGSSDQTAMNNSIHKALGKPKDFISPFDKKLRDAIGDAVDFYWDDWSGKREDHIDDAIRKYYQAYFPKMFKLMQRMFD